MEFKSKELRGPALRPFRRFILGELKRDKARLKKMGRGDALHDFRVSTRRVHTWVQAIGPTVDEAAAKPVQKGFKWLLSNTTDWRDGQVHKKLVKQWRETAKGEEKKSLELVYDKLSVSLKKEDKKLAGKLRKRFSKVSKRAKRLVKKNGNGNSAVSLSKVLAKTLGQEGREFVRFYEVAEKNPTPPNLHYARIAGKKFRYLIEPFKNHQSSVPSLVTELKEFQDDLGYVHDLDVLAQRIEELCAAAGAKHDDYEPALKRCLTQRERKVEKVTRTWFGEHGKSLVVDVNALSGWFESL